MSIDLTQDFFTLFGLHRRYAIDDAALEAAWHELQSQVHPDRHAHLSDVEKRLSMQWATRVNEGFRTLRQPLTRAQYLLELAGVDAGLETNTAMSPEFLMEQMEWREALDEADGADALDALLAEARDARRHRHVEALHRAWHRDTNQAVAVLAGQAAHALALGAHHQHGLARLHPVG